MNRFDDRWFWRILEIVIIPIITAAFTAAAIYGSLSEKVNKLDGVHAESRIVRLETDFSNMKDDVGDIKHDVRELLRRTR